MDDFRVPTHELAADILLEDGRLLHGVVFLPALSALQIGPMPPEEWINSIPDFFPFRREDGVSVLLNKSRVLAFTAAGGSPERDPTEDAGMPSHELVIDAAGNRFRGTIVVDMPENKRRVVDYFNRSETFVLLRGAGGHHLIRKSAISIVLGQEG